MDTALTILFALCGVAIVAFIAMKIIRKKKAEARMTWIVPLALLDAVLPVAEQRMIDAGFAKSDYVLNVKDCSEYAPKWIEVLAGLLAPSRPDGETEWMKQYSFQRDLRADGSDPGRHRVVAIKTDAGIKCIDTYRINGSLYRELSDAEKENGYYI